MSGSGHGHRQASGSPELVVKKLVEGAERDAGQPVLPAGAGSMQTLLMRSV